MMVEWSALVLPTLLSAVLVFVASSVIHMVLKLHNPDYHKLANEDEVRAAIRKGAPPPAQYILPHCTDPKQAADPEMARRFEEGPVAVLYIRKPGMMKLGPFLGQWMIYLIAITAVVAYLARRSVPAGAELTAVLRVVGTAAWLGYAGQSAADSIWMGKPWTVTFRTFFDAAVYALLTGVVFGWLWPR